jgi:hypothetical protein
MSGGRVGLDCRGRSFLIAEVAEDGRRPSISGLIVSDQPPGERFGPEDDRAVGMTISDRMATVKVVLFDHHNGLPEEDLVRFELGRALLEPEREFEMGVERTGADGRYLGVTIRRRCLADVGRAFGFGDLDARPGMHFELRSIAIGRGYLAYCHPGEGDLVALVDLADEVASICLLYRRRVVDVASVVLASPKDTSPGWAERFAVDLKTVLNFRLANLLDAGIGVPLARLLLWGERVDDSFRGSLQSMFPIAIGEPSLNEALFANSVDAGGPDANRFLAALGLTVN